MGRRRDVVSGVDFARRVAAWGLWRVGSLRVYQPILPRQVVGLCYHVVTDRVPPHVVHLERFKTPAEFERDLVWLKRNRRLVSFGEALAEYESGRRRAKPPVLVSFDDGYAECFSVIRPLLLEHGIPAVFFITRDFIDNRRLFYRNKVSLAIEALKGMEVGRAEELAREFTGAPAEGLVAWLRARTFYDDALLDDFCARAGVDVAAYLAERRPFMTADQVRQLAADGFTIGGHTLAHPYLHSLRTAEEVEMQIVESCRFAAGFGGGGRTPFAFPFRGDGLDRGLLRRILDENPWIGPLFDVRGVNDDAEFIANRVIADTRPAPGSASSNVPDLLRVAYREAVYFRCSGRPATAHDVSAVPPASEFLARP